MITGSLGKLPAEASRLFEVNVSILIPDLISASTPSKGRFKPGIE